MGSGDVYKRQALTHLQVAVLHGLVDDLSKQVLTMEDVLRMHLSDTLLLHPATGPPLAEHVATLESYMTQHTFQEGEVLFERGDAADAIFVVLSGSVVSVIDFAAADRWALFRSARSFFACAAEQLTPRCYRRRVLPSGGAPI